MGQEFIIKSPDLEDKINQLLPSQGGFAAGVDLSASTQIIPIVDLTETAEGSNVRADLQTALSFTTATAFSVNGSTANIIQTTGYYRIFGAISLLTNTSSSRTATFRLTDGASTKDIVIYTGSAGTGSTTAIITPFDFVVFTKAGESVQAISNNADTFMRGSTRQIADISGNLIDP